jgi:Putative lumazine-binding
MMWFGNFRVVKKYPWACGIISIAAFATMVTMVTILAYGKQGTKPDSPDHNGVRVAIEHYFKGHATGDPSHMRKAFLPTAHIEGIRDGKFVSWTLDSYCENFKGKPAVDESARKRSIDWIDVTGTAAMAKATLIHGQTTFTDYFVLLKVEGEWKIANKVYHGQRQ